ncbi:hypothetical protein [Mucilaginibacter celer]|nr:hypothetical protein [Mucilaginibacter celer]
MEFYFNDQDTERLFNFIQQKGGSFIPDIFFDTEMFKTIADSEEFLQYRQTLSTHFFLIAEAYSFENLSLSMNRFIEQPAYAVNQRKGGPYIDFSFYRGFTAESVIPYKRSEIDIYSKFIHVDGNGEFAATENLKRYYNDIVAYIKSCCKAVKKGRKTYWISVDVLREIE